MGGKKLEDKALLKWICSGVDHVMTAKEIIVLDLISHTHIEIKNCESLHTVSASQDISGTFKQSCREIIL